MEIYLCAFQNFLFALMNHKFKAGHMQWK